MTCHFNTRALVCLAVATLSVAVPAPLFAECIRLWHNINEAKAQSTLVFSGSVTKFKPDPDGVFVTFAVTRVWKGTLARQVELPLYLTLDSFRFDQGIDYLVFADRLSQKEQSTLAVPTETAPVFHVSQCGAALRSGGVRPSLMCEHPAMWIASLCPPRRQHLDGRAAGRATQSADRKRPGRIVPVVKSTRYS